MVAAVVVRRRWSDGGARLDLNLFVVEVLVRGDTGQVEGRDGRQEQPHPKEDQTHRLQKFSRRPHVLREKHVLAVRWSVRG